MPYKKQKIEKIFFTIGEVAAMLDVTPSSIRYWESNFEELAPQKSSGGTRLFSQNDIETLKLINYLVKDRGLTIKGARMKLKHNREDTINNWEVVNRLKAIREKLIDIKNEMES